MALSRKCSKGGSGSRLPPSGELGIWECFLGCFGEIGGEWICLGVVDLLGIISFFLLSLVVRKLVVGYLKDTNAGEWWWPPAPPTLASLLVLGLP